MPQVLRPPVTISCRYCPSGYSNVRDDQAKPIAYRSMSRLAIQAVAITLSNSLALRPTKLMLQARLGIAYFLIGRAHVMSTDIVCQIYTAHSSKPLKKKGIRMSHCYIFAVVILLNQYCIWVFGVWLE